MISDAVQQLRVIRTRLAYMERYADEMAASPHGSIYLRELEEASSKGLDWALAHCRKVAS